MKADKKDDETKKTVRRANGLVILFFYFLWMVKLNYNEVYAADSGDSDCHEKTGDAFAFLTNHTQAVLITEEVIWPLLIIFIYDGLSSVEQLGRPHVIYGENCSVISRGVQLPTKYHCVLLIARSSPLATQLSSRISSTMDRNRAAVIDFMSSECPEHSGDLLCSCPWRISGCTEESQVSACVLIKRFPGNVVQTKERTIKLSDGTLRIIQGEYDRYLLLFSSKRGKGLSKFQRHTFDPTPTINSSLLTNGRHSVLSMTGKRKPDHSLRLRIARLIPVSSASYSGKQRQRTLRHAGGLPPGQSPINPITFKSAESYLVLPPLRLYDQFTLRFSIRTDQSKGIILFNSGPFGVDFIAFQLLEGGLFLLFDMGSGVQRQCLRSRPMNDQRWHCIELRRDSVEHNVLELYADKGTKEETSLKIPVQHGDKSKNFDLADYLYLGGIPSLVFFRWREKLWTPYGFQGCIANFSVNNEPAQDLLQLAREMKQNDSLATKYVGKEVVARCLSRQLGVNLCEDGYTTPKDQSNDTLIGEPFALAPNPHCSNGGVCIQMWADVQCACELTTFQGRHCSEPGTTLSFGLVETRSNIEPTKRTQSRDESDSSENNIGYVCLTYKDEARNTDRDEFIMGIQTGGLNTGLDFGAATDALDSVTTLMYVSSSAQNGDFFHLYLQGGYLRLDCDYGGGILLIAGPKVKLNDGFYHRIRGFRSQYRLILEVDEHQIVYKLKGKYGRKFNAQENIWLGHAPVVNHTDFFQGFMTGAYYNGLLLCDVASGLSFYSFVHVTRYANVKHVTHFTPSLAHNSPFQRSFPWSMKINPPDHTSNGTVSENLESKFILNTQADIDVPVVENQVSVASRPTESIQRTSRIDQVISSTVSTTLRRQPLSLARITSQVNIWLLACLTAAGCIMLVSIIFLAYRFGANRVACPRQSRGLHKSPLVSLQMGRIDNTEKFRDPHNRTDSTSEHSNGLSSSMTSEEYPEPQSILEKHSIDLIQTNTSTPATAGINSPMKLFPSPIPLSVTPMIPSKLCSLPPSGTAARTNTGSTYTPISTSVFYFEPQYLLHSSAQCDRLVTLEKGDILLESISSNPVVLTQTPMASPLYQCSLRENLKQTSIPPSDIS